MDKEQYKGIMVFAEQRGGVIQNVAFELLGKATELAQSIGEKVTALLWGYRVSSIPAKCCIAPEIPIAKYTSGRTVLPV